MWCGERWWFLTRHCFLVICKPVTNLGTGSMLTNEVPQRTVVAVAVMLLPVKKKLRTPSSFQTWLVLKSLVWRRGE